jgi:hypothetical protein
MPENVTMAFFIVLAILFVGWFALGTQANIRKGDTFMRWLQEGLPLVGEKTTMRWMGSSVLEMKIAKAKPPLRTFDTLAIFEPRDVIFLWLLSYLQGRRDWIIFRAQLQSTPSFDLDLFDPKGWTTNSLEREVQKKNWTRLQTDIPGSLLAYTSGNPSAAKPIIDLALQSKFKWARIAIHRDIPNVEVHLVMPSLKLQVARELLAQVRQICEASITSARGG